MEHEQARPRMKAQVIKLVLLIVLGVTRLVTYLSIRKASLLIDRLVNLG